MFFKKEERQPEAQQHPRNQCTCNSTSVGKARREKMPSNFLIAFLYTYYP